MGILSKIIGAILLFIGASGILARVPNILLSSTFDQVNPFIKLGLFEPSVKPLLPEFIFFLIVAIIGLVLILYNGNNKNKIQYRR